MTMNATMRPPLAQRINLRLVLFAAIIFTMVGYPSYYMVRSYLTHGVVDHGAYQEVDLQAMSSFEMNQVNGTVADVPAVYRALDGKRVKLEGEMYSPNSSGDSLSDFVLVYSISKCCVTPNPKVQHMVYSKVPPSADAKYYNGQVRVTGTLHINVEKEAGKIQSLYKLDVEDIEPM